MLGVWFTILVMDSRHAEVWFTILVMDSRHARSLFRANISRNYYLGAMKIVSLGDYT